MNNKMKKQLLKECSTLVKQPHVKAFYTQHMEKKSQYETINVLEKAVRDGLLTVREALAVVLVVGFQWSIKFDESEG